MIKYTFKKATGPDNVQILRHIPVFSIDNIWVVSKEFYKLYKSFTLNKSVNDFGEHIYKIFRPYNIQTLSISDYIEDIHSPNVSLEFLFYRPNLVTKRVYFTTYNVYLNSYKSNRDVLFLEI